MSDLDDTTTRTEPGEPLAETSRDTPRSRAALDDGIRAASQQVFAARQAGNEAEAARIFERILSLTEEKVALDPADGEARTELAILLHLSGRSDEARSEADRSLAADPSDRSAVQLASVLALKDGDEARAAEVWDDLIGQWPESGEPSRAYMIVRAAKVFAFFDRDARARAYLDLARPLLRTPAERDDLRAVEVLVNGAGDMERQAAHSVEIFDAFAKTYDQVLFGIQNRGPFLIRDMVQRLGLTATRSRDILDAGCGTGLCGPLLREYARTLHGCDISIGMLEQSRARNVYDLLTRSDISVAGSLPEGPFDVIVAGDVMVYFGTLSGALSGLAQVLKPGGWIVFTTELAQKPAPRGWHPTLTHRYRHDPAFVRAELTRSGFSAPRHEVRDTLRHEFMMPVEASCVAAQKLALASGPGALSLPGLSGLTG
ncbi:methyltransferase domain-containing protein [Roseicyclus sp. F158]|uniref:Methyltransferase domain-containing protein n=1 Tax=Tropicimonas omnivorans TaxID=3075590 RepID=A0ABU3DHF8_9RHOB|nr:methyltransferase domain-containing protein [Roseicyclus sp. F158]MDT0683119.1 methyltransferase domain-containing protein [Roseicyclus sp. F158]